MKEKTLKIIGLGLAFVIVLVIGLIIGFKISDVMSDKNNTLARKEEVTLEVEEMTSTEEIPSEEETTVTEATSKTENETAEEATEQESEESEEDNEEEEDPNAAEDAPDYLGDFHRGECAKLVEQRKALYGELDSYENTMAITAINEQIIDMNEYNFANKKVAFLGDSITLGLGGTPIGQDKYFGYDEYLEGMLNIGEIIGEGSGGSTIGRYNEDSCFQSRLKDEIPKDVDIIICMGGVNDYIDGAGHFGDMEHLNYKDTYCGSVDTLYYTLKNSYKDADVFIVTPYRMKMEEEGTAKGIEFADYIQVQRELAEYYRLPVFDVYNSGILNTTNPELASAFSADSIHLNDAGYEILAKQIGAELVSYYGSRQ